MVTFVLLMSAWLLARTSGVVNPKSTASLEIPGPESLTPTLKFAVLSDIHSDLPHLSKALGKVRGDSDRFLIVTGDLTTVGTTAEFQDVKKALDNSGIKYHAIPGNHDWWGSNASGRDIFNEVFGPDYQSFKTDGYKFILIDNADPVGMDSTEMSWIKESVGECRLVKCLVFMHEPLNHPTSDYTMGQESTASAVQANSLITEFKEAGATTIYAGHLHSSSHYTLDGLTTTIVGAVTSDRNWQTPRFLEVTVGQKDLVEKEVVLD